jgi:hypothetical protein
MFNGPNLSTILWWGISRILCLGHYLTGQHGPNREYVGSQFVRFQLVRSKLVQTLIRTLDSMWTRLHWHQGEIVRENPIVW